MMIRLKQETFLFFGPSIIKIIKVLVNLLVTLLKLINP